MWRVSARRAWRPEAVVLRALVAAGLVAFAGVSVAGCGKRGGGGPPAAADSAETTPPSARTAERPQPPIPGQGWDLAGGLGASLPPPPAVNPAAEPAATPPLVLTPPPPPPMPANPPRVGPPGPLAPRPGAGGVAGAFPQGGGGNIRGNNTGFGGDRGGFAAAAASFGMLLRESPPRGGMTCAGVLEEAAGCAGDDPGGHRKQFLGLVRRARGLHAARPGANPPARGGG